MFKLPPDKLNWSFTERTEHGGTVRVTCLDGVVTTTLLVEPASWRGAPLDSVSHDKFVAEIKGPERPNPWHTFSYQRDSHPNYGPYRPAPGASSHGDGGVNGDPNYSLHE